MPAPSDKVDSPKKKSEKDNSKQKKSGKDEKPASKMKRKMTVAEQKEVHDEKKAEMTKT